ncbi:hypothetical protein Tco_0927036 [Tanacetum coccineum]|uniref:Uncharacterized protein n=1 Tax=Tanacetum coccineum TaxID=301880 RepID=A0ABQ5DE52_9ASTR
MDEEGEVKKNGIKDEHSDGEIVPESLFEDGELENNHVDGYNSEDSLKHHQGFTPLTHNCENDTSEKKVDQNDEFSEADDVDKLKGSANGSISAGHFKMVVKMKDSYANLEELIGTQGGKEVIQETKMEKIEDFCVKQCWGNSVFDYVYSEAVGNSGGEVFGLGINGEKWIQCCLHSIEGSIISNGSPTRRVSIKKLGNGLSTLFWDDVWCDGGKLKNRFPRAYALENSKQITVGQKLAHPSLYHSFRRHPKRSRTHSVEEFAKVINPVGALLSSPDHGLGH